LNDYEIYFKLISQDDNDDTTITESSSSSSGDKTFFSEAIIDGTQRHPHAAWEWGMVEQVAHRLVANAFEEIGDKPRSVICSLDRGLDLASGLDSSVWR